MQGFNTAGAYKLAISFAAASLALSFMAFIASIAGKFLAKPRYVDRQVDE